MKNDLSGLYLFADAMPDELKDIQGDQIALCDFINKRLKKAIDAFESEAARHQATQANYSEALGEIRGLSFAFKEAMGRLMREHI